MPRISDLQVQKKDPYRVSLFLDGEFWTGMPTEFAAEFKLVIGREVSAEERQELERELAKRVAVDKAGFLLSYRARSKHELKAKLKDKGFSDEVIDIALETLEEYGYVNDYDFAAQLIESEKAKGRARRAARSALYKAGVDRELQQAALDEFYPTDQEFEVALEWARGQRVNLSDPSKLQRQLASRGFSYEISNKVIRSLGGEVEEI